MNPHTDSPNPLLPSARGGPHPSPGRPPCCRRGPRDSLRRRTRPRRRCPRSRALQSQRCRRNWCWHSAVQAATPRPMESIASGCRRHSCRCRLTSPGTLSHMTRDEPTAPMYLREGRGRAARGAVPTPVLRLRGKEGPQRPGAFLWRVPSCRYLCLFGGNPLQLAIEPVVFLIM